ncbi:MAG: Fur family transcriptional regulator [Verrucomicrobiota bacterium]
MEHTATDREIASDFGDLRMTRQRQVVFETLTDSDLAHPTASEIFVNAKERMPSISLATVYNCLESLAGVGAIKQVNIDREASRYCPNLQPHAHFYCTGCDTVFDIGLADGATAASVWDLPEGSEVEEIHVAMKGNCGTCPDCVATKTKSPS